MLGGPKGGKLGEIDKVYPGLFVEEKAAKDIGNGLLLGKTPKTYVEAAEEWGAKNIFDKTSVRINNLPKTTQLIPEEGAKAARAVPNLGDVQATKKFHFVLDDDNPYLINAAMKQIERLKKAFPDYSFTIEFLGKK